MSTIIVDGVAVDLTVGCDPELFVKDEQGLVSAHGMVEGTKEAPSPVEKGAIQVDGMALEFNINPAESREVFIVNTMSVMQDLVKKIPQGHTLVVAPTANFGKALIDQQPDEAKELGCSADYNAYMQGAANPKPNGDVDFRTAGGHIHVGFTENAHSSDQEHQAICQEIIKMMDLMLGVPSVLLDDDKKRRSLYGAAGAYRSKPYGVEYRSLSNFWLKSKEYIGWVYDQTEVTIKKVLEGLDVSEDAAKIQRVINSSDKQGAKELVRKYNIQLPV